MEIRNRRKVPMRAAKLAGLILLLSSFNLFGQDLDGKYETFAAGGDVAIRFTFIPLRQLIV